MESLIPFAVSVLGSVSAFNHLPAGGDNAVKANRKQIFAADKTTGSAAVDEGQVAVLPEFFYGTACTVRNDEMVVPEGIVYVKKYYFSFRCLHFQLLSLSYRFQYNTLLFSVRLIKMTLR